MINTQMERALNRLREDLNTRYWDGQSWVDLKTLLNVLRVEYAAEDYRYRDGLPMGEELVTNQEERERYYGTRPVMSRIVTDWERVS